MQKQCLHCNDLFTRPKRISHKVWATRKFCSTTCHGKHQSSSFRRENNPIALYPELRLDIDNGRTLCITCHKQTDTWGHGTIKLAKQLTIK